MAREKIGLTRRLFPRTLLSWTEPRAFQRARNKNKKGGNRTLPLVTVAVSSLFIGVMGALEPGIVLRLVGALASVLVFMGFVFWVYRTFPYQVAITDTYITHDVHTNDAVCRYFKDIDRCEIAMTAIDGQIYPALTVVWKNGDRERYGIAPAVSLANLAQVLESRGVRVLVDGVR
jgi:hypothetical protein